MPKNHNRDEFSSNTIEALAKRVSYICSNPDCRALTVAPSEANPEKYIYIGEAAHITASAPNGPRYDPSLTPEQRQHISNGIFLCKSCARKIDVNKGIDFPADLLRSWKQEHEQWVRDNLNKSPISLISVIDGEHHASGIGDVTALDIQRPVFIKPGTKSTAQGRGNVTATRIGFRKEADK